MSDVITVGLDPGLEGGLAALVNGKPLKTAAWPTVELKKTAGGVKTEYQEREMLDLIREVTTHSGNPTVHVFLEKQHAMKGQGVTSMFSTGYGYGILRMALVALRVPWTLVGSQQWQKVMLAGLPKPPPRIAKKGKNAGKEVKQKASQILGPLVCARLWPDWDTRATLRSSKPHTGITDALLIAEFGRRLVMGGGVLSPGEED